MEVQKAVAIGLTKGSRTTDGGAISAAMVSQVQRAGRGRQKGAGNISVPSRLPALPGMRTLPWRQPLKAGL